MFAKCITTQIIQGSEGLFYAIHFTECLNDVGIKASALIAMDSSRDSVYVKPFFDENFGYCFCCLIGSAHCKAKFSKRIGNN